MDGTKILSMSVENFHFLDSLNSMPMNLINITKSFDLTCKKGYYPLFYTANNFDYVGPYSEPKYYGAAFMSVDEQAQFLACFEKIKTKFSTVMKNCWPTAWITSMS